MSDTPLISVIIATFNRCETLKVTLDKLSSQSLCPRDFEIVVVDDGSADGTASMIELYSLQSPCRVGYFRHENRGPGYTQNIGIKEAKSDLVLLMADDVWPTSEMLEKHLRSHREYPEENFAVLGKVLQSPDLPPSVMHKYWDPFRYDMLAGKHEVDAIHFLACNISLKKKFLLRNGMYKERKGAAHEDIELGYRLRQKGLRIICNEQALGHHYHPETLSNACRRAYERGLHFDMLSDNIPKSFIFPLYHFCSLEAGFKSFMRMLPREVFRKLLFNKWLVNSFWLPVLRSAETSRFAEFFANDITYRGAINYHQRRGYWDKKKQKRKSIANKPVFLQEGL